MNYIKTIWFFWTILFILNVICILLNVAQLKIKYFVDNSLFFPFELIPECINIRNRSGWCDLIKWDLAW